MELNSLSEMEINNNTVSKNMWTKFIWYYSKKIMEIWSIFNQYIWKWIIYLIKIIRHIFLWCNKELNKKNGYSATRNFSIKRNKQTNENIKAKEVSRHTYCDEFDNTVNDDIQRVDVAVVVVTRTKKCVQRGWKNFLLLTKIT